MKSPGQTTHCSRFPDPKDSIYVLFSTVFLLILLLVTFKVLRWVFPFFPGKGVISSCFLVVGPGLKTFESTKARSKILLRSN